MKRENNNYIEIKGARVNNLKNVDLKIPRNKLIVITGLSGSGKSSLAFDTIYAEGQRRYVESLSAYARQFLGRMSKPECDYIKGIPPAIAIEQRVNTRNPRSTVGTSTEIYEYLKLLFARIGRTFSPISGTEVKKERVEDVVDAVLGKEDGMRFVITAPLIVHPGRNLEEELDVLQKEGYTRVSVDGVIERISALKIETLEGKELELLIDRLSVARDKSFIGRLSDSVETAFFEGHGICSVTFFSDQGVQKQTFSKAFEADGLEFEEPSENMFSFNNPIGACPTCEGFGKIMGIDENLVVPDKTLSVYEGAIMCWKGPKMGEWLQWFIKTSAKYKFPIHKSYYDLSDKEKDLLWHGNEEVEGIDSFFKFVEENLYKIQYRVMLARYRGKTTCPVCKGTRLRKEALYVQVGGKNIAEIVQMSILDAIDFFEALVLPSHEQKIAERLLIEIKNRLHYLKDVGLGYLTLDRLSNTLSGGESQRINLATSLGSSLVGSLYILDEPSIGLHSKDTDLLIKVLQKLRDLGNTVIIVEHDEDIIRSADYIIDIGPKAGRFGGEIVYEGAIDELPSHSESYTVAYLTGQEKIPVPKHRRHWNSYIEILGARKNNLQGIDVKFPLHTMTVVTGVSGSGKSSLVRDLFYEGIKRVLNDAPFSGLDLKDIRGDIKQIKQIEFVDQNSIGKNSRSNPVTYVGAYDEIRKLFSNQPLAKQMKYTQGHFSFNKPGGRCEECKGEGTITVEMQFMADLNLVCENCHGKRFKKELLEVEYRGMNIADVLDMTINQAISFFGAIDDVQERAIVKKLIPLQSVGLGYIKLGQPSSTLSGGENQRVKLAYHLGMEQQKPTLFIFDEPTTGLHFHDISTLLKAFNSLIEHGHSIIIVEHNPDVIKCADFLIDLGPGGGKSGGNLVFSGTPEEIINCEESYTGKYLKEKLEQ